MVATISTASTEYIQVVVSAKVSGAAVDPTGDVVKFAFLATDATPSSGDLLAATWDTDESTSPSTYRAQCLIGPSGVVTLVAGTYRVWVQVTDSPEIVLRRVGSLRVI